MRIKSLRMFTGSAVDLASRTGVCSTQGQKSESRGRYVGRWSIRMKLLRQAHSEVHTILPYTVRALHMPKLEFQLGWAEF